jgi:hypothetical protein
MKSARAETSFAVLILALAGRGLPARSAEPRAQTRGRQVMKPAGAAARYLTDVTLLGPGGESLSPDELVMKSRSDGRIQLDLEPGGTVERLALKRAPSARGPFKVEQQTETSMAIGDEGPHMDLTNWKHHRSDWKELKASGADVFVAIPATAKDFPNASGSEIVEAVRAESKAWAAKGNDAGTRWIDLAKKCKGPNGDPCYVAPSKTTFRISVNEDGRWREIYTIELLLTLGC